MEAPRQQRVVYPLHLPRAILRAIGTLFLFLAFCLLIADGVACVNTINGFNSDEAANDFYEDPAMDCWTDPLYGDVRPLAIVRALPLICTMSTASAL
jgi:hypothetical protein